MKKKIGKKISSNLFTYIVTQQRNFDMLSFAKGSILIFFLIEPSFVYSLEYSPPKSLCSDLSTSCAGWAKEGECSGDNAAFTMRTCPSACGLCTPDCRDKSSDCHKWANTHECTNNPANMLQECPVSCGVCSVPCMDRTDMCSQFEKENRCHSDVEFMFRVCPVTCKVCSDVCHDRHEDCSWWAKDGMCHSNPAFMLKECPQACDVCRKEENEEEKDEENVTRVLSCKDNNQTQCKIWADANECAVNPLAVIRDCPQSCGACSTLCIDKHDSCEAWKNANECVHNYKQMLFLCPASCGLCRDVDATIPFKSSDPTTYEKDEL